MFKVMIAALVLWVLYSQYTEIQYLRNRVKELEGNNGKKS